MPKGVYPRTDAHRKATGDSTRGRRFTWSEEDRKRFSRPKELEHAANIRKSVGRNWRGGEDGDYLASILCPLGYVREYQFVYDGLKRHNLDFALLEEKVNIELDGVSHMTSKADDEVRDARMRSLGWKVIRVKL